MNGKLILTLVSALVAAPVVAGEWQTVSVDTRETVLLQSESIHVADGEVQVKVVRDYRSTQLNLFDHQWVAHRSKVLVYSIDCEAGKLGLLEWSLHAGSHGKGRALVKGQAGGVVDYVKAANVGEAALLDAVCVKVATLEPAKNRLVASTEDNFCLSKEGYIMGAKVIVLVLILVVWTVLVSAAAHAARVETEEAQEQEPRANVTRLVVGAVSTQEDGECESPRPSWIQHDSTQDRGRADRAVCPNV